MTNPLGPTFETERLILRPPLREDFDPLAAFLADETATRFLGGPMIRELAWTRLVGMAGSWSILGFGMFSVVEKATGRWVGRIGPIFPEGWPGREVGWGIAPWSWGQGYATEAAARCMDFVFDDLGWTEVIHCIAPENLGSAAVARRLGSRLLGPGRLPPPYQDETVELWGQTREQWREKSAGQDSRPAGKS